MDSFLTFADKVLVMTNNKPELKVLQAKKIRYNGGVVNMSMLRTINSVASTMTPYTRSVLVELEYRFGREVVSLSYNKLRAMIQQASASRVGKTTLSIGELMEWVVEALLVTLLRKEAQPSDFPIDTFNKSKDGTPSWIAIACMQRSVVAHITTIVYNLAEVDEALATNIREKMLPHFASPRRYHNSFPVETEEAVDLRGSGVDEGKDTGDELMKSFADSFPRNACMMAEILRKVFNGSYSESLRHLCNEKDTIAALTGLGDDLGTLGKDMRDMLRAFQTSEGVSAEDTGTPPLRRPPCANWCAAGPTLATTRTRRRSSGTTPGSALASSAELG